MRARRVGRLGAGLALALLLGPAPGCEKKGRSGEDRAGVSGAPRTLRPLTGKLPAATIQSRQPGEYEIDDEVVRQVFLEAAVGTVELRQDKRGYRLTSLSPDSIFRRLGFQEGDLITSIADIPMNDPTSALEAYAAAAGRLSATVALLRDNEPVSIRFALRMDPLAAYRRASRPPPSLTPPVAGLSPVPAVPSAPLPPPPLHDDFAGQVERIDDTHVRIKRALVDKLRNDPNVARHARIVPSIKNGQVNGIKLYAIRPSSPLAAVTLRNGDTITAVNGKPIDGLQSPLAILPWLPGQGANAKRFDLSLIRRGHPTPLRIDVE